LKLYCSYRINKIASWELNVWPLFISVLLKFRNERYGHPIGTLAWSLDIDKMHLVERSGLMYSQLLGVLLPRAFRRRRNHTPYLCHTWFYSVGCLVCLCRAGSRHLHVPQNSRQPWDLKWLKTMGNRAWALLMCLGGPNLAG